MTINKYITRDLYKNSSASYGVLDNYNTVQDGIIGSKIGKMFIVNQKTPNIDDITTFTRVDLEFKPELICFNGLNFFYFDAGRNVLGKLSATNIDRQMMVPEWETSIDNENFSIESICCGDEKVFIGCSGNSGIEILSYSDTGEFIGDFGRDLLPHSATRIVCNGKYVAYLDTAGGDLVVIDTDLNFHFDSVPSGMIVSSMCDLAITGSQVICTSSVFRINFFNLDDGSNDPSFDHGLFTNDNEILLSDENSIYFSKDVSIMVKYCYPIMSPFLQLSWVNFPDPQGHMSMDDKYICMSQLHEERCLVIDKHTGREKWFVELGSPGRTVSDGINFYCFGIENGYVGIYKIPTERPSKVFLRVSDSDQNRSPFFNLAIPV